MTVASAPFGDDPIVVAYGAGVDSTAMLVGLHCLGVRPAMLMFADTGPALHLPSPALSRSPRSVPRSTVPSPLRSTPRPQPGPRSSTSPTRPGSRAVASSCGPTRTSDTSPRSSRSCRAPFGSGGRIETSGDSDALRATAVEDNRPKLEGGFQ